jgi:adenylate cyclase
VQRKMALRNAAVAAGRRIEFRVGIHQGDIVVEDGDIFGDGVNVAARLEGIADPGGICVSARVQEDAAGRLDLDFEDLGEPELKNIARKVRVYRVRAAALTHPAAGAPGSPLSRNAGEGYDGRASDALARIAGEGAERQRREAGEGGSPALSLPDKPSIAVLPFQNMSGDPEQEYFADGMVEEIITALSRIRWLFVIARNSSFTYKGQAVDVKRVGRELGVRYVLEGSVRKSGNRVRITGQLIDTETGTHLWADRFDGALEDVFDLQDQVASSVAGVIEPTLQAAEIRRSSERPTNDLSAYDLYLRALPHVATYLWDDTIQAIALLQQAIQRDPGFASALARAAYCHAVLDAIGRVDDRRGNRRIGIDLARRALLLGGDDPLALAFVAHTLGYFNEDIAAAIAIVDRSTALNPSGAYGWRFSGFQRLFAGQCELAIGHFERSMRLSPREPRWAHLTGIAMARFFSGQFEDAAAKLSQALQENPTYPLANRALASCYAHMGRLDEARDVLVGLRAITPMLIPEETNYRNPEHRELFLSGLRLATGEAV